MKLLASPTEITNTFNELFAKAEEVKIAVAWVNADLAAVQNLLAQSYKVKRMVVGVKFYGTSPEFLRATYRKRNFRFHLSEKGTFHPKLYLFHFTDGSWKAIIGSANFTVGAFEKNHELCVLIGSNDKDAAKTLTALEQTLNQYWDESQRIGLVYIKDYEIGYAKRPKTRPLPKKGIIQTHLELSWDSFVQRIEAVQHYEQLQFLRWVKQHWGQQPFSQLDKSTREIIAGFNEHTVGVNHRCFGTTDSRWTFIGVIHNEAKAVEKALSQIPKNGTIQKSQYEQFLKVLLPLFTQNEVAAVSRLLSLYRPDFFIPYNGKNKKKILIDLNLPVSKQMDYDTYWDQIVSIIQSAPFNHPPKKLSTAHAELFANRAALLDCLYYEHA